jgi:hypothetical protein
MIAKRRMLLNPLKVRYADAAVFMDIASVINSYELAGDVSLKNQYGPPGAGNTWVALGVRQLSNWGDRAIGNPRSENGECRCGLYRVAESPVLRGRGVFARVGSWNSTRRQATRGFLTVKSGNRPKSRSAVQSSWTP